MENELKLDNFFKSLSDDELLEWEKIYNHHLTLTIADQIHDRRISSLYLRDLHDTANKNLKIIKEEQLRRSI
jgi:hypothetical protein